jgi:uncharacterized membrane protein
MRATLAKWLDDARSSYWFVPALMAISAIGLAILLTALDETLASDWLAQSHWLLSNQPEGARSLLAAIAGSMITVAGVTFSVTISSVVYAASQFGPRLLTNFMQDRGNQVTLGTFISAFIYCLLILRTVRSAGEAAGAGAAGAFVPQLATLGALGFALAGVAVLIYFIHHVPATVHISHVIARIGGELNGQIGQLYTAFHGAPAPGCEANGKPRASAAPPDEAQLREHYRVATPVYSDCDGYLQHLHGQGLLSIAREQQLLIFVVRQPGDFIVTRRPLVYVWPAVRLEQEVAGRIRSCFAFGKQRTQAQDLMFLVQELVEIAVRALSPGVNDPATAIKCMDWLSAVMSNLARRRPLDAHRYDDRGELRVVYRQITFPRLAEAVCGGLRPHAKRDPAAALHLLGALEAVAPDVVSTADRQALLHHVGLLNSACQQTLDQEEDRAAVAQKSAQTLKRIRDPGMREDSLFTTPGGAENA